jgi:hypothetical protein
MTYSTDQLLTMASSLEELSSDLLETTAAKKKDKKKLDPKAKVRNRGTVCVPAEQAKDKKDHFPINDEDQAQNALSRVHQYSAVPPWYRGSLKGLQDLVSRKVHSKYPSIGKDKKKSSSVEVDNQLLSKYASPQEFFRVTHQYEENGPCVSDFAQALKMVADQFGKESDLNDPIEKRIHSLMLQQARMVESVVPDIQMLDQEIQDARNNPMGDQEVEAAVKVTKTLLSKYGAHPEQ